MKTTRPMVAREKCVERNRVRRELETKGYYIIGDNVYDHEPHPCEFVKPIDNVENHTNYFVDLNN